MKFYILLLLLTSNFLISSPLSIDTIRNAKLYPKEAMYSKNITKDKIQCTLCPHYCVLSSGEKGKCRARANIDNKLLTLVYNSPLAIHIDPVEKKPLYHFYPQSKTFSIATAGCNLKCIFCQNWSISQADPEKAPHYSATPEQIVNEALRLNAESIAFTYTEPTIFYEYMFDIAKLAKSKGLKTLYITCGYINPEPLKELCKYIDAANIDLKGFSEEFYKKYCSAKLKPVLESIKILHSKGVHIEITNLLIPQGNDNDKIIRNLCKWVKKELSPSVPIHFSRFHPAYQLKNLPPTSPDTLIMARNIALEEGLYFPYTGNLYTPDGSSTNCPKCKKLLIERKGYQVIKNFLKQKSKTADKKVIPCCPFCGHVIYGKF